MNIDFEWEVPEAGFEWLQARPVEPKKITSPPQQYLVPIGPPGAAPAFRRYRPLDHTGLFRRFSETAPTKDGVFQFAKEFGRLGGRATTHIQPASRANSKMYFVQQAEDMNRWGDEIETMKNAIELWEGCRERNRKALSQRIHWQHAGHPSRPVSVSYIGPESRFGTQRLQVVIAMEKGSSGFEPIENYKPGDVLAPAWRALLQIVNVKLQEHTATPQLAWPWTAKVTRRWLSGREQEPPSMQLVPGSLISALWMQVLHAITGNKEYSQCHQCGRWFEVAAQKRADARFCSNACRFKAYRARQKKARQMQEAGVAVKEIADRLGSDVHTIKGWVSE